MIVVIELISRMMHCLEWRNDDDGCWMEDGKKKGNAEDATDATRSRGPVFCQHFPLSPDRRSASIFLLLVVFEQVTYKIFQPSR